MKSPPAFGRRKALKLTGAALLAGAAFPLAACTTEQQLSTWEGEALGAPASIQLYGGADAHSDNLFKAAAKEAARLEGIFSLYDPTSEISRLNKRGWLNNASAEMIEILNAARQISVYTAGAFDITVQPLWNLSVLMQRIELKKQDADRLWAEARALVDFRFIEIKGHNISFTKPGVAITLNGIAQGYISDKIADLLQREGAENGLVNIGEFKAFGRTEGGEPWRVGIQNPNNILEQLDVIELRDQGLATSAGMAGKISDDLLHIFDTRARSVQKPDAPLFVSASVVHKSAMVADGFATAFTLMDEQAVADVCSQIGGLRAILVRQDGDIVRI